MAYAAIALYLLFKSYKAIGDILYGERQVLFVVHGMPDEVLQVKLHLPKGRLHFFGYRCFFWRYLARRHAASFWTKQAVDILVERVRDLGKHRFVPAPIGGLLDAVVSTLSKVFAKLR